jgi:sec-independent protein translocase protein TatB
MFGLGFIEILIIFVAVIVFVNPKDLPKFFRTLGRLYQQIRDLRNKSVSYVRQIEREIEKAGNEAPEKAEKELDRGIKKEETADDQEQMKKEEEE